MSKNLNKALERLNYNPLAQEIIAVMNFTENYPKLYFSLNDLSDQIAKELAFTKFKYHSPSDAIREPIRASFINLLKETKIVDNKFEIGQIHDYSDSYSSDTFSHYDYLVPLKNKFNQHIQRTIAKIKFSELVCVKELYKKYMEARIIYHLQHLKKAPTLDTPSLEEFAEIIQNHPNLGYQENDVYFE